MKVGGLDNKGAIQRLHLPCLRWAERKAQIRSWWGNMSNGTRIGHFLLSFRKTSIWRNLRWDHDDFFFPPPVQLCDLSRESRQLNFIERMASEWMKLRKRPLVQIPSN